MKKLVKLLASIGCFVGCMASGHVNAASAATWTGSKTVTSVQIVNTGGIIIYFDSIVNAACTDAGTNSVYVLAGMQGVTAEGVDAIRASAFIGLTTGMSINVLYDETTSRCYGKYILVTKE